MNDMTQTNLERALKIVGSRPARPDGVDKVTGRALFGADKSLPNMLVGRVLRSPYAHAKIISIDTSKAEKLEGVKAIITSADFEDFPSEFVPNGEMVVNMKDITRNVMAREKVLYVGHTLAAVARLGCRQSRHGSSVNRNGGGSGCFGCGGGEEGDEKACARSALR